VEHLILKKNVSQIRGNNKRSKKESEFFLIG